MKIVPATSHKHPPCTISRRRFGEDCAAAALGLAAASAVPAAADGQDAPPTLGVIRGEPTAERVGLQILKEGGNAIDAAVAAALTAAIAAPHQTGIGGYGGHMTLAMRESGAVTSIDFNSAAPAAATPGMFPLDDQGKVRGQANMYGWLAAGVPGILAGLELALKRHGTKPFRVIVQPAIALAREGFVLGAAATNIRGAAKQLGADPASQKLYFKDGQPLAATDRYVNADVAMMLEQLAKDNSVESFYRGEIAEQIAAAYSKNGGLVTKADLAAYAAREVRPLMITWNDWTIHTAPLAAGGATMLEAMLILQALKWADRDPTAADTAQLQVEAFRFAWQDRLAMLGDPHHAEVPLDRLLDPAHAQVAAAEIERAVADKRPLPVRTTTRPDQGTISLSVADQQGNLVNVTLTHGGSYGARVTVPGLGLTLGHGMSRFDPHAGHPNAPGPGKRPLNNMCPTIVAKSGRPLIAVGARGGRKIPNTVAEVLLQLVARGKGLNEAVAAPRMHTEGALGLTFEKAWSESQVAAMKQRGYDVSTAGAATVSAVGLAQQAGGFVAALR